MQLDQADQISGFRRANKIIITNPPDSPVTLSFELEWLLDVGGAPEHLPAGSKTIIFTPDRPLTIVHPDTGETLMQASDAFVMAVMWSLYVRDIAGQAV